MGCSNVVCHRSIIITITRATRQCRRSMVLPPAGSAGCVCVHLQSGGTQTTTTSRQTKKALRANYCIIGGDLHSNSISRGLARMTASLLEQFCGCDKIRYRDEVLYVPVGRIKPLKRRMTIPPIRPVPCRILFTDRIFAPEQSHAGF